MDDIVFPMEAKLNVGVRFKLSGKGVTFPFDLFTYEVTSIEGETAKLRIVDHSQPQNCSNALT